MKLWKTISPWHLGASSHAAAWYRHPTNAATARTYHPEHLGRFSVSATGSVLNLLSSHRTCQQSGCQLRIYCERRDSEQSRKEQEFRKDFVGCSRNVKQIASRLVIGQPIPSLQTISVLNWTEADKTFRQQRTAHPSVVLCTTSHTDHAKPLPRSITHS